MIVVVLEQPVPNPYMHIFMNRLVLDTLIFAAELTQCLR